MNALMRLAALLEMLGGARPVSGRWRERAWAAMAWGVWWLLLLAIAAAFAGRNTKFVYVDF